MRGNLDTERRLRRRMAPRSMRLCYLGDIAFDNLPCGQIADPLRSSTCVHNDIDGLVEIRLHDKGVVVVGEETHLAGRVDARRGIQQKVAWIAVSTGCGNAYRSLGFSGMVRT